MTKPKHPKSEPVITATFRKTQLVTSCPHCHKSSRLAVALFQNEDTGTRGKKKQ